VRYFASRFDISSRFSLNTIARHGEPVATDPFTAPEDAVRRREPDVLVDQNVIAGVALVLSSS
jgi:hypothetical protein